jgi:preprotein translocase subunit YajC
MPALIVSAVICGLAWVLLIIPRQRQVRAHADLVRSLEVGDEIVTGGGIFGTIVELDGEVARIEVAPGVVLRLARAAVLRRRSDVVAER